MSQNDQELSDILSNLHRPSFVILARTFLDEGINFDLDILCEMDGYATSIALTPNNVSIRTAAQAFFTGVVPQKFEDRAILLLCNLIKENKTNLDLGNFTPVCSEIENERERCYSSWCEGFMLGIRQNEWYWGDFMMLQENLETIYPIIVWIYDGAGVSIVDADEETLHKIRLEMMAELRSSISCLYTLSKENKIMH